MENTAESANQQQTTEQTPAYQHPFNANVQQRDYTQANTQISAEQASMEIPEPVYSPQTAKRQDPYSMLGGDGGKGNGGGGSASNSEPFNPAANNIPESDQKVGAEHLTKIFMDMYVQAHEWGNKALQISEKKLNKMQLDGEIDLNINLPFGNGTITAGELLADYNSQTSDALVVSREFKKEVPPVLTRILQKRGAVLTDEQYLGYLIGKDILVKGVIAYQMNSTLKEILTVIKESTATGTTKPAAKAPDQKQESPVHQEDIVKQEEVAQSANMNAHDFNFQNNEAFQNAAVVTMQVPQTGRDRAIQQRQKEEQWEKNTQNQSNGNKASYKDALKGTRKPGGGKGRNRKNQIKSFIDNAQPQIQLDEDQVAENLALQETVEPRTPQPGE